MSVFDAATVPPVRSVTVFVSLVAHGELKVPLRTRLPLAVLPNGWIKYHAVPSLAMAHVCVDPDAGSDPNTLVAKTV